MTLIKVKSRGTDNVSGRRNLVHNGAMRVAQRGTSESSVTASQYADAPDRFKVEISSAGTWTVSQSTTAPSGFSNSYKFDCTTADASLSAGDYIHLSHYIEGQDLQHIKKGTASAEKLTLYFYVRSTKTGTYCIEFYDEDNSRSRSASYTISTANAWEKKVITIDGDTTGALNNDTGIGLGIFFFLGAGSNFTSGTLNTSWNSRTTANIAVGQVNLADNTANEWYITGVQLEVGDSASDFEHRSFDDYMEECERYFQTYSDTLWQGTNEHAANYSLYLDGYFRKKMRATPTATIIGTVNIGRPQVGVTQRPNSIGGLNKEGFYKCNWPSSGTYGGQLGSHGDAYYRMGVGAGPTNRIDFSAEL